VKRLIPDKGERLFYVCGPQAMVESMTAILRGVGVTGDRVRREVFPGY